MIAEIENIETINWKCFSKLIYRSKNSGVLILKFILFFIYFLDERELTDHKFYGQIFFKPWNFYRNNTIKKKRRNNTIL